MYKYIKKENDNIIEAPFSIEKNGNTIIGYNKQSNNDMLIQDGYLLYEGNYPNDYLDIINNQIIQLKDNYIDYIKNDLIYLLQNLMNNEIIIIKNNQQYILDVNFINIEMIKNILIENQNNSDNTEIDFELIKNNQSIIIKLTKSEITKIYNSINLFNTTYQQQLNNINNMTDQQILNENYINEFKNICNNEFNNISNNIKLDE